MAFWKKRGKADEDAPSEVKASAVTTTENVAEIESEANSQVSDAAETSADSTDDADATDGDSKADATDDDVAAADSVDADSTEEADTDEADSPDKAEADDADVHDDSDEDSAKEDSDDEKSDDDEGAAAKDDDSDSEDSDDSDDSAEDDDEPVERSEETEALWAAANIDPVEIVLPSGTGFTLRHYRVVTDDEGDELEEAVFLAHKGKLQLFKSAEGLVDYVKGDAEHDLKDDSWAALVETIKAEDVQPLGEDEYELDLVVQNLRGGHDVWDQDLLIGAGEVTRDIAFACQLDDVLSALAPDTPLDDLDDALRASGFIARRKVRKISPERAAIAWRSLIGKVDAAVKWHD
ncbi:hypothetical protein [Fodinicola feengrottensis]|uniref:hypothetical protein n=1 Tax=Fodinicola feengrottensis TaxID=435914 RepID=UPI0013D001C0|nr:hypothetical protein [Fodinicola feengrottensis]